MTTPFTALLVDANCNSWSSVCVECLFLRTPNRAPYRTPSACANRTAYPDPPPVVPHPESIDSRRPTVDETVWTILGTSARAKSNLVGESEPRRPTKVPQ